MIGMSSVRRVEIVGVVVLREDAALVDALGRDLGLASSSAAAPASARRARRRRAHARGAAPRSTATQHITFDATKCFGSPRISQMPWSGSDESLDRLCRRESQMPSHTAGAIWPPRRWCDGHRVEQHPPHVVLVLVVRAVADAHRPGAAVAGEVVERVLGEVGLAADAVHDLEVEAARRRVDRRQRLEHEREVLERLPVEAEVVQRAQHERGVADPRVAVVPVALAARRLGQRRRAPRP